MRLLTIVVTALALATGCVDDAPVSPPSCADACLGTNPLCNRLGSCTCTVDGKIIGCRRPPIGSAAPLELDDSPDADVSQLGSN